MPGYYQKASALPVSQRQREILEHWTLAKT